VNETTLIFHDYAGNQILLPGRVPTKNKFLAIALSKQGTGGVDKGGGAIEASASLMISASKC
jgi:hypothetical protein